MYPEQIKEGLRPWQPKKFYMTGGFGGGGRGGPAPAPAPATPPVKLTVANTAMYDPLLCRTYAEIGSDARASHKCQGTGGCLRCLDLAEDAVASGPGAIEAGRQLNSRTNGEGRNLAV